MHFVCLATTLIKDEVISARDSHVLAPNFAGFNQFFTDRLSNEHFVIWLLTTQPYLKYVAILPCNLSVMSCFLTFMFHKVVRQQKQEVVKFLIIRPSLLQIY